VVRGWVDAGTTYTVRDESGAVVYGGWLDLPAPDRHKLRPIAFSEPIPCDNLAHRAGLERELVERLTTAVVDVRDDEGRAILADVFRTAALLRADLRLYDPVRDVIRRTAKLDT
jgi:ABC-type phosphate/phosphonate transport system substrate-binding protein